MKTMRVLLLVLVLIVLAAPVMAQPDGQAWLHLTVPGIPRGVEACSLTAGNTQLLVDLQTAARAVGWGDAMRVTTIMPDAACPNCLCARVLEISYPAEYSVTQVWSTMLWWLHENIDDRWGHY